jgi:hypothetical protein
MKKHHIMATLSLSVFLTIQFTGCSNYYLQKARTDMSVPDATPLITDIREKGETRFSAGIMKPTRTSFRFNDNNHADIEIVTGNIVSKQPYTGRNITVNFPEFQGQLGFDYMITDHFFFYGNCNMGYIDDHYSGAGNLGIGLNNKSPTLAFQSYFFVNGYSMHSDAEIKVREEEDYLFFTSSIDSTFTRHGRQVDFGYGTGIQFATVNAHYLPHITWGADFNFQKYYLLSGTNPDETETDSGFVETKRYRMFFLTPSIGAFQHIGNSQITILFKYGLPWLTGNTTPDRLIKNGITLPSISLKWTYCFR